MWRTASCTWSALVSAHSSQWSGVGKLFHLGSLLGQKSCTSDNINYSVFWKCTMYFMPRETKVDLFNREVFFPLSLISTFLSPARCLLAVSSLSDMQTCLMRSRRHFHGAHPWPGAALCTCLLFTSENSPVRFVVVVVSFHGWGMWVKNLPTSHRAGNKHSVEC